MVLLTSTAVSAVISAAIICAFTFLLFLSGYVLQQRTVRSLREALRQPPEPKPIPTLPPQFSNPEKVFGDDATEKVEEVMVTVDPEQKLEQARLLVAENGIVGATSTLDILQGTEALPAPTASPQFQEEPKALESLAYLLTIPEPSDLCSAALFARQQRSLSSLTRKPSIILLYPSGWETSPTPLHIAALTFLRDIQDEYSLTYHPVDISSVWSGVGTNSQLLSELQRNRWDYDRLLYLKSPGMAMDTLSLDKTLQSSSINKQWALVSASAGHDPEMLFWSRRKGLMMPRGDMRKLTVSAMTSHANHHAGEMDLEVLAQNAAYVLFDEEELDHRRSEKEWYGGLFEKFERERSSVCKGRGLLHGEQDKVDLRRRV